ncbi:glycosyltransferase family 4 protein [Gemmata sp. JC717]|uniref:glycosyltransferase family 4 protein n=1 Tax=Gemmata algarum TaxID=2975278 RepID=UPI0021BBA453|nr:glycosyltransferase family 4 protein [Gemmata algarum]MDY3551861.1 glycosyltransferase family 4 protein [Gemmata algarum]
MTKLAIVTTHPVQYYAPWFRHLAERSGIAVRVFYLWDFGVSGRVDPTFGVRVTWDVPLLDGYEHEFVPNRSRRPGTNSFWGIDNPGLLARLKPFAPDAVLCLGYNYATFAKLLLSRPRYPLILRGDSHRLVPRSGLKARLKRAALARVFRRFAAFLYVGQANREYYRLHGVPEDKLVFCPHAVDNDRFTGGRGAAEPDAREWRAALGIPGDHRVVLFAGKFEPKKRPLDLLEAFRRAAPGRASLLFVGNGPQEPELRRAAAGVPNVFFAPFQNQSRMPRTYAAADLVVLPSYGPGETWGLCVNEAMCLGRPVIVSSHVGCGPDLVRDDETGGTFPAGDVGALAARLRAALADPGALAAWGRAGEARVGRYSYEHATAGLLTCLARLKPSAGAAPEAGTIGRAR